MPSDPRSEGIHAPRAESGEPLRWLDDRRNVARVVLWLYGLAALLLLLDLLVEKHGPFAIEHWFGFYAIAGFAAPLLLVLGAKALRGLVMRPEDYYDR